VRQGVWNRAHNVDNKVKIAEVGGIEAVLKAMEAHKTSVRMQQQACWALCMQCNNAENQVKVTEAGGIEALVAAAIEAQGKFPRERARTVASSNEANCSSYSHQAFDDKRL